MVRKQIICGLVLLFVTAIGSYWTHLAETLHQNEKRFFMHELVSAQASAIERRLSRAFLAAHILAQEVRQQRGLFAGFENYADQVLRSVGGISSLQLAPAGIISHIYPLAGNEKAIGHNILRDDPRRKEAQLAIDEHRLTLAGPFQLIQGGVAIIGRKPVYLPSGDTEVFWGFASALIFIDELLITTELDQLESKGYSYQLTSLDPVTAVAEVFASSSTPLSAERYSVLAKLPNATWQLVMSRPGNALAWSAVAGYLASLLAGFLIAWILHYVLRQPQKLRLIVQQKTAELEHLAYHDHLTGLANRRALSGQLKRVLGEHGRYGKSAVFLYLDLDDFKRVNDSLGHDAGDALLKQIAERLSGCVRSSDIVARLGGDEFGILLLESESVRDVSRIAEKLIDTIKQPVCIEDRSFVVSTSVGITRIPADGQEVDSILCNADLAMYSAKKAGKQAYRFYDSSLQAVAVEKLRIEDDLVTAVEQSQFVLHYQPIIALGSVEVVGYEALIRWQHPDRGLLYPVEFIAVAEENGTIIDIGYWVIRQACLQLKANQSNCCAGLQISVNLSPRQFKDPNLLGNIRSIVQATGVAGRLLEFDITESCLMDDVDNAIKVLQQLKQMGISVAIDDFGTGYSSLALVKHLPVDKLKIDRSFVTDLETDPSDRKVVQGIISMAHKLELKVVAEGIESAAQLQLLQGYDCDLAQGFLFSKPVPSDELASLNDAPAGLLTTACC